MKQILLANLIFFILFLVMHQPLYINDADDINNTEDIEEDLETPTGENIFPSAKVGWFICIGMLLHHTALLSRQYSASQCHFAFDCLLFPALG